MAVVDVGRPVDKVQARLNAERAWAKATPLLD
jgi:hypothetical protein